MLLELTDVAVRYGEVVALDGIDLCVEQGEAVGVIGANGAGKTSLLKAISGLVAYAGQIRLDETVLSGLPAHEVPRLGIAHVPEGSRLFPEMSVEDNLRLGAYPRREARHEDFERVYDLFPRLRERRRQTAGTLSGGERQMVAIARGLMLRPRLLMLDEPSLGIAPVLVEQIYETIQNLARDGHTILLVEQNVGECLEVTDRCYVLQTGSIAHHDRSSNLGRSDDVRSAFLGI